MLLNKKRHALHLLAICALTACGDPCAESVDRAFFDREAAIEGAIRTESGLIYQQLSEGYGPYPGATDRVTVHYKGTFADGTVFDSSYERGYPSTLSLETAIPGWAEGLQLIKGGGKARLVNPAHLAYGNKGKTDSIPPSSTLIFEIELFGIKGS